MIPQDNRDTLRIGFKSGSVIEVKVEDGKKVIAEATPNPLGGTPVFLRAVVGDAMVDFAQVEFMQVVPKEDTRMDPAAFNHSIPPFSLVNHRGPDYSRNEGRRFNDGR